MGKCLFFVTSEPSGTAGLYANVPFLRLAVLENHNPNGRKSFAGVVSN